jgi:hypothetical protein
MDDAHEAGAAARRPACGIDDQILTIWRALRTNPSLDARWAMQAIDRLLDERPRPAQARPAGPPAQEVILASILRALLTDEPE